MVSTPSPKARPASFSDLDLLTPSEIASLQADKKALSAKIRAILAARKTVKAAANLPAAKTPAAKTPAEAQAD